MTCPRGITRREFLTRAAAASAAVAGATATLRAAAEAVGADASGPAAKAALAPASAPAGAAGKTRVVVIRHASLAAEGQGPAPAGVRELLDEAARALAGDAKPADAWARWFKPDDCLAIKVNCLGYATRSAVALGLAVAVGAIGLAPGKTIVWDRLNRELAACGYTLQARGVAVRCFGTDELSARGNRGYTADVLTSGATGSLLSRIVTDEATALVSASILKDHNLAGLTGALKNFFGAIHNPNKYHDNGCDPFIADACAQEPIRRRLRLAVCDATWPQYNGGPAPRRQWQWPYGGLILSTDPVAVDAVARDLLERRRAAAGLKSLADEKRPVRHLASAQARGLGTADLAHIEVISLGKPWVELE
ncbi:MAG: DUF362 domain-containing protein [Planctomycetes bacterium]|nr:DUF362 domain-containing protein [Planctomycetota bacterium]